MKQEVQLQGENAPTKKPVEEPSKVAAILRGFRSGKISWYENRLEPKGTEIKIPFVLVEKNGGVVAMINDDPNPISLDQFMALAGWDRLPAYA